jgi:hypothetical protein
MGEHITMRRLKIQTNIRKKKYNSRTIYPTLRIEGNWLNEAGFTPDTNVIVIVEAGKIVIKPEFFNPQKQTA